MRYLKTFTFYNFIIFAGLLACFTSVSASNKDDFIDKFEKYKKGITSFKLEAYISVPLEDKLHSKDRYERYKINLIYNKPYFFKTEYSNLIQKIITVGNDDGVYTYRRGDKIIYHQKNPVNINAGSEYRIFIGLITEPLTKYYNCKYQKNKKDNKIILTPKEENQYFDRAVLKLSDNMYLENIEVFQKNSNPLKIKILDWEIQPEINPDEFKIDIKKGMEVMEID